MSDKIHNDLQLSVYREYIAAKPSAKQKLQFRFHTLQNIKKCIQEYKISKEKHTPHAAKEAFKNISLVVKSFLSPKSILPKDDRDYLRLELESETLDKMDRFLKQQGFRDFLQAKTFIKDHKEIVQNLTDLIMEEFKDKIESLPAGEQAEIHAFIEKNAQEELTAYFLKNYHVPVEKIKKIERYQNTQTILDEIQRADSAYKRPIPSLYCVCKDLSREELEAYCRDYEDRFELSEQVAIAKRTLENWDRKEELGEETIYIPFETHYLAHLSKGKIDALNTFTSLLEERLELEPENRAAIEQQINYNRGIVEDSTRLQGGDWVEERALKMDQLFEKLEALSPLEIDFGALFSHFEIDEERIAAIAKNKIDQLSTMIGHTQSAPAKVLAERQYRSAIHHLDKLRSLGKFSSAEELLIALKRSHAYEHLIEHGNFTPIRVVGRDFEGLSSEELGCLKTLSQLMQEKRISYDDREALAIFLSILFEKKELRDKILNLRDRSQLPGGITADSIEFLTELVWSLEPLPDIDRLATKFEKVAESIKNEKEIKNKDRLSIEEYRQLIDFADLQSKISELKARGVYKKSNEVESVLQLSNRISEQINDVEEAFAQEIDRDERYFRDGDILLSVSKKRNIELNIEDDNVDRKRDLFVTPYSHAAAAYRATPDANGRKQLMQSHIYGEYANSPVFLLHSAVTEVWRVDVPALMNRESPHYLAFEQICEYEGKKADEEVQRIFEEVSKKIHEEQEDSERFADMSNDPEKRMKAGYADYTLRGHKRKEEREDNFFNVYERYILGKQESTKRSVICSEFVAKALVGALMETDRLLQQKVVEFAKDHPEYGMGVQEEAFTGELKVLKIPYGKREKLKRIHPGRLVKLLQKENCIQRVERPPLLGKVFREKELRFL